jgi:hypothetical protein
LDESSLLVTSDLLSQFHTLPVDGPGVDGPTDDTRVKTDCSSVVENLAPLADHSAPFRTNDVTTVDSVSMVSQSESLEIESHMDLVGNGCDMDLVKNEGPMVDRGLQEMRECKAVQGELSCDKQQLCDNVDVKVLSQAVPLSGDVGSCPADNVKCQLVGLQPELVEGRPAPGEEGYVDWHSKFIEAVETARLPLTLELYRAVCTVWSSLAAELGPSGAVEGPGGAPVEPGGAVEGPSRAPVGPRPGAVVRRSQYRPLVSAMQCLGGIIDAHLNLVIQTLSP